MTKSRPWIRLYTDLPSNPKAQRLPGNLFKFWVNCLCLYGKKGYFPNVKDLAWSLKLSEVDCLVNVRQLISRGLLEVLPGDKGFEDLVVDALTPHDWDDLQFESDSSTERVAAFRKRSMKRPGNVTVTVQEQSRAEQIQIRTEEPPTPFPDSDIATLAESLHSRHPANGCGRAVIVKHLTTIVRGKSSIARATTLALIDENHAAWCATSDWQRGFAKGLENWLAPSMMRWKDGPKTKPKTLNNNGNAEKILIDKSREWLAVNPGKTINDYVDWSIQNQ